ncbi:ATP-binding protein [Nocardioides humilatus]|uniref:ATP-binding protein n=1 Tax=Nocardioides humilatus TaxID=2607660 RepID=UPI00165FBCDB|nr:ATP-binding protein [Nocardioides humilatus]
MSLGLTHAGTTRAWLLGVYLFSTVVGRASIVDDRPIALVWPAAGVALAWFVTERSEVARGIGLFVVCSIGTVACLATGVNPTLSVLLVAAQLTGMLVVVVLLGRWAPGTGERSPAPLDSPQALFGFLGATGVGCLVGVVLGLASIAATGHMLSPVIALAWWGRNVCGVVGVGITTLLLIDRSGGPRQRPNRHDPLPDASLGELAVLLAAAAALVGVDYATTWPVTFLMPAITVWAGMRFAPLTVASLTLGVGGATLWLAVVEKGPFSGLGDVRTDVLLAQLFVAMTFVVGLVPVAMRERTAVLQAELLAQENDQRQELLTFAHRVAHDLRTPITVIDAWTDELARSLDAAPLGPPPGSADMLEGIARASSRMRSLVDDLLADAIAREREAAPEDVDLAEVVAQVARDHYAEEVVHTNRLGEVRGDPVLIRQLVENLLGNALKYTRPGEGPDVTVSACHTHGGRVVVTVADRGVGIPDGAHDWIFEPFRRAHSDDIPGTGLGLSTCRRIVERHGGSIRALSRPDGPGAVIEFDLMGTR